jgi:adenine-specific DNA-methyltransferase
MPKPQCRLQTTTWWSYPSQQHRRGLETLQNYAGATPSYIIWNLLRRYTRPNDLVVDPMCGSGTTIDVARQLARRALGYDLRPIRPDIFRADARKLRLESGTADFLFVDPPYSNHIRYSRSPSCLGEMSAEDEDYYRTLGEVLDECRKVLHPGRFMALFICDSYKKGKPFRPLGFRAFSLLCGRFQPVDIVAVARNSTKLREKNRHAAAIEGNFFLRGFGYLFIMYKPAGENTGGTRGKARGEAPGEASGKAIPDRRVKREMEADMEHLRRGMVSGERPVHTGSILRHGAPRGASRAVNSREWIE